MCDESKLWTLVVWRYLIVYHFHMPWITWWNYTLHCFWQFGWFGCNYFLCKVGKVTNLHETSNSKSVFTFHLFCMVLIGKNHKMLVFMFDPRVKNMCLVTLYVGYNNTTNLVIDHDSQLLLFFLVESYKSPMPTTIEEFSRC